MNRKGRRFYHAFDRSEDGNLLCVRWLFSWEKIPESSSRLTHACTGGWTYAKPSSTFLNNRVNRPITFPDSVNCYLLKLKHPLRLAWLLYCKVEAWAKYKSPLQSCACVAPPKQFSRRREKSNQVQPSLVMLDVVGRRLPVETDAGSNGPVWCQVWDYP